jgi:predicted nucleotidyltransferase component of viral defense system
MKLHFDKKFFSATIRAASQHLQIREEFVEKDYWITLVLQRMSQSKYANTTVFKGGTSLSKGFGLIDRFSADVDLAIINTDVKSGNEIETIIRTVEKDSTTELTELETEGVTSKGSRFRKSVYAYTSIDAKNSNNKLIVEINSFANPFPFKLRYIKSMLHVFLLESGHPEFIEKYDLKPFEINLLNKEQTMVEKLVSLIRFSFDQNAVASISGKIRHFYDLHFLVNDNECATFIQSDGFKKQFELILSHDRELFGVPDGWQTKEVGESPLIKDFDGLWEKLKNSYKSELSALAYKEIPDEKEIAKSFKEIIYLIT